MDKPTLQNLIQARLAGGDVELITLKISSENDILVEVDSLKGVDLDYCAELSRYLTEELDKEPDFNYSLEVGSVSLSDPFVTHMQYQKHLGDEVEVLARDGKKYKGQLVDVEECGFAIDSEEMVLVEGKKRRQRQIVTRQFAYADVKYTKYEFKC